MNATDASAAIFGSLISLLLFAGFYVWMALALSAVFRKSGVEPWQAWVPVLNAIVLLRLAGLSPWLVVLAFFPILNIAFLVAFAIALYRVNVAFGLGVGMTVLGVLLFPVWASIVGWGSARWVGREQDAASRAPFGGGVRRSGDAAGGLPPLPPFPTPTSQTGVVPAFAQPGQPGAPMGFATSSFAPPPPYTPPAPAAGPGAAPHAGTSDSLATPAPAAGMPYGAAPQPAYATPVELPPVAPTPAPAPPVGAAASAEAMPGVVPPPGGWTPPPLPGRPAAAVPAGAPDDRGASDEADPWQGFALDSTDLSGEVTGAVPGAPAPISAVPVSEAAPVTAAPFDAPRAATAATSPAEADAESHAYAVPESATTSQGITRPPVTRVPAAGEQNDAPEPWAPAKSPMSEGDAFPEASGPVSAIAGAPDAGSPRSARSSVSAFHAKPEIPDEQDVFEETVIARRKRTDWTLLPPTGDPVALSSEVVILGRRPAADPDFPGAQLIAIADGTVSKTHARLRLRDDRWYVTDLDSTNGVLFATVMGTEVEVPRGEEVEAGDRFLLGDAEVRLQRSDG